ncbi:MAG: hypothetical protein AAF531_15295, partial [Actinomycetota bacterium]
MRSFYEDWSFGNEYFTAYLEQVGSAGGRRIELVQLPELGDIPGDLAVVADFTTVLFERQLTAAPACQPILARGYSHGPRSDFELLMPALTTESEARLMVEHLRRSVPNLNSVGVLVVDHPSGDALLGPFVSAVGPGVELYVVRHEPIQNDVSTEVIQMLNRRPQVLVLMTYGEPCHQATLAVGRYEGDIPEMRMMPSACRSMIRSEGQLQGWHGFQQPHVDFDRLESDVLAVLEKAAPLAGAVNVSDSLLAAWWLVAALEAGVEDRVSLVEALLSV